MELKERYIGRFLVRELALSMSCSTSTTASAFQGFKIVQLTDLHYGRVTSREHIENALKIVKSLQPDALFLTGDYLQLERLAHRHLYVSKIHPKVNLLLDYKREVRALAKSLGEMLSELRVPSGIFGVFGNHDYREGTSLIVRNLPKHIRWLTNSSSDIVRGTEILHICGVDDYRCGRPMLRALSGLDRSDVQSRILMSHNPDIVLHPEASLLSNFDLVLCGHTHGGQICLPLYGPVVTRTRQREHTHGLSYFKPKLQPGTASTKVPIYVSHGIGYGFVPLRMFCPPEITVVTLTSGEK